MTEPVLRSRCHQVEEPRTIGCDDQRRWSNLHGKGTCPVDHRERVDFRRGAGALTRLNSGWHFTAPATTRRRGPLHGSNVGDACGISFFDDDLADFVD
jgi:hypothetical protein